MQQSRFLALVGNYSRLAELTEEAANSQDAGTLQYLKTLDSIESKLNQLQVAFQEFYTSMGLENVFKGALDALTVLITQLNSLPKLFDTIPIAAIGMGANLVLAIKNLVSLVAVPIYQGLQRLKQEIGKVTGSDYKINLKFDKNKILTEAYDLGVQAADQFEAGLNHQPLTIHTNAEMSPEATQKISSSVGKSIALAAGSALQAAGSILAVTELAKGDTYKSMQGGTEQSKVKSGAWGIAGNIAGSALSGAAVAGLPGAFLGALLGVAKSVPNIITLIDGLNVSTEERIAQLNKEIEAQKEQVIIARNQVSSLETAAKKLSDLQAHQYDSVEASQEYYDYMNQLAESHTDLVSTITLEGNSVIDLNLLYKKLLRTRAQLTQEEYLQQRQELELAREYGISAQEVLDKLNFSPVQNENALMQQFGALSSDNRISDKVLGRIIGLEANDVLNILAKGLDGSSLQDYLASAAFAQDNIKMFGGGFNPSGESVQSIQQAAADMLEFGSAYWDFQESAIDLPSILDAIHNQPDMSNSLASFYSEMLMNLLLDNKIFDSAIWQKVLPNYTQESVQKYLNSIADLEDGPQLAVSYLTNMLDIFYSTAETVAETEEEIRLLDEQFGATKNALTQWAAANATDGKIGSDFESDNIILMLAEAQNLTQRSKQEFQSLYDFYNQNLEVWPQLTDLIANARGYGNLDTLTSDLTTTLSNFSANDDLIQQLVEIFTNEWTTSRNTLAKTYVDRMTDFITHYGPLLQGVWDNLSLNTEQGSADLDGIPLDYWNKLTDNYFSLIESYINQGLYTQAQQLFDAYTSIINFLKNSDLSQTDLDYVLSQFTATDLNDSDAIQTTIKNIEAYATAQNIDVTAFVDSLADLREALTVNINTAIQNYATQLKTAVESGTKLGSNITKGLDYSDMQAAAATLQNLYNLTAEETAGLFEFDQSSGKFFYTTQGLLLAQDRVYGDIESAYNEIEQDINQQQNSLKTLEQYPVAISSTFAAIANETDKVAKKVALDELQANYQLDDNARRLLEVALAEGLTTEAEFRTWLQTQDSALAEQLLQLVNDKQMAMQQLGYDLVTTTFNAIDFDSIASGVGNQALQRSQIRSFLTTKLGKGADVESLVEKYFTDLQKGGQKALDAYYEMIADTSIPFDYDTAKTAFEGQWTNAANLITELLETKIGSAVSEEVNALLVDAGFEDASENSLYVIDSFDDALKAAQKVYETLKGTNKSIANYAYAAIKEAEDAQVATSFELLENSVDLSYDNLADFANLIDMELEQALKPEEGLIQQVNGKYRLTTEGVDKLVATKKLDTASLQFLEALKNRNDALIEADQKLTSNIVEEVNALTSAKIGDQINLTYLQNAFGDFGGQIVNGILEVTEDTNILQLANDIRAQMEASGQFLQSDIVALGDAIDALLKSYASLISSGIQGSLSQSDAANLKSFASGLGVNLDFTRTKDGLKISTEQAGKLYQELKKVDAITAQLVFDDFVESLSKAGSGFENISQTMARIAELQEKIAKAQGDTSGLEQQLQLYQEIARAQSDNPDSFSFMDNNLPNGLQGPMNYWNAAGKAFSVMNQAGQNGYMEIQDFYNITQEMQNLAIMSGNNLEFMGQTIYADGTGAAELIEWALSALSNIDADGVKIDFSKLGQSFSGGAADMASGFDDAIKEMARAQIEMLDAEIAMLEAIVAMEELGDIDVDKDGILNFDEIFAVDEDKNATDFSAKFGPIKDSIRKYIEESEELAPLLEQLTINGHTLGEILNASFADITNTLHMTYDQYTSMWNGLYQAMMSGEYDLDAIISSVADILSGSGNRYSYTSKDGKKTIYLDETGSYEIEWDSDRDKERIEEALKNYKGEREETDEATMRELMRRYEAHDPELSIEDKLAIQVFLGNIDVNYDDNGHPVSYKAGGQTFPNAEQALNYLALKNSGANIEEGTVVKHGNNLEVTNSYAGLTVTTSVSDQNVTWTITGPNGEEGTGATRDDAMQSLWQQMYPDGDVTFEEFNVTYGGNANVDFKVDAAKFGSATDDLKTQLAEKLSDGDYAGAQDIALKMGVAVQLINDDGSLNTENLEKLQNLTNTEEKTIYVTTVQGEGSDPLITELLETEAPLQREVDVDISATGDFTTDFIDSLNNLNAENLSLVVLKLAALSRSMKTIQNADFSNIDTLIQQWEEVLSVVQKVQEVVEKLTNRTFTVNINGNGGTGDTGTGGGQTTTTTTGTQSNSVLGRVKQAASSYVQTVQQIIYKNPVTSTSNTGGTTSTNVDVSSFTKAADEVKKSATTAGTALTEISTALAKVTTAKVANIIALSTAINSIPSKAYVITSLATAINQLKSKKVTIDVVVNNVGGFMIGSIKSKIEEGGNDAKGNVALAGGTKQTLVGELGPELVVSQGHYYVVGQNGAEFVDLDKDAIVFNHMQTKKLLGSGHSGRGRAITNEKTAVSWATGNVEGPAMASAKQTLAELRQIRAMWQALLSASGKDLGALAGRGAGGGGGGGGGDSKFSPKIGDYERWYNLLRQIEKWEQKINLAEAQRQNMQSGYDYARSLQKELNYLQKEEAAQRRLVDLQRDFYDKRRADQAKSAFSQIFTFDEDGLMQFVDGAGKGLDILAHISATDENGRYIRDLSDTAVNQVKYLKSVGFDYSKFAYDKETGQKLDASDEEQASKIMDYFWEEFDGWIDELDELYDAYNQGLIGIEELMAKEAEIRQEFIDNQLTVEDKLVKAIEDREQAVIDALNDEKDALQKAADEYIGGLTDALQRERDMYSKNQSQNETTQLQRQLAILQRSGGSASDIKNLQNQINERLRDNYFEEQQDQIDAIQEASDREIDRLDKQIELLTDALEYQKENGLLWAEVSDKLNNWSPAAQLAFIDQFTKDYISKSALAKSEADKETQKQLEMTNQDITSEKAWQVEKAALEASGAKPNAQTESAYKSEYDAGNPAKAAQAAEEDLAYQRKNNYLDAQLAQDKASGAYDINGTGVGLGDGTGAGAGGQRMPFGTGRTVGMKLQQGAKLVPLMKDHHVSMAEDTKAEKVGAGKTEFRATAYWQEADGSQIRWIEGKYDDNGKEVRGWFNANAMKKRFTDDTLKALRAQLVSMGVAKNLIGFSSGGLDTFTGIAMLHGTKRKPEAVLNAEQTSFLRNELVGDSEGSLRDSLAQLRDIRAQWDDMISDYKLTSELQRMYQDSQQLMMDSWFRELDELYNDYQMSTNRANNAILAQQAAAPSYNFENIVLNFEPGMISNDYDARRAGDQVWDELLSIARRSGNVTFSRR